MQAEKRRFSEMKARGPGAPRFAGRAAILFGDGSLFSLSAAYRPLRIFLFCGISGRCAFSFSTAYQAVAYIWIFRAVLRAFRKAGRGVPKRTRLPEQPAGKRKATQRVAWSWWPDLNRRPADYESAALPTEPHQHQRDYYSREAGVCQEVKGKKNGIFIDSEFPK